MNSRTIARAALLLLIISAALPTAVDSCFITTQNVAVFRTRPDGTWKEFLNGKIGVIQPRWSDSYLYAAYRQLSGQPFTEGERNALIRYYADRSDAAWLAIEFPNEQVWKNQETAWKHREERLPISRWIAAREQVPGAKNNRLELNRYDLFYAQLINCTDDAFLTAITTLKDRQQRFGNGSDYVRQWLEGQDAVFLNCQQATPSMPDAVSENAPMLLKQDRAYQQAAAYFYSRQWDAAHNAFRALAADPSSPWSAWGAYLAARCLIRKSTLSAAEGRFDGTTLRAAEQELQDVLAHTKEPRVHRAAEQMMGFIRFRLHPQEYQRELDHVLASPSDPSELVRRLKDYLALAGAKSSLAFEYDSSADSPPEQPKLETGEIAEWIWAISAPWTTESTLAAYRSQHNLPWLVAALANAKGTEKDLDGALAEAAKVPASSPAYIMLNFHRTRLLRARGEKAEARAIARKVLARTGLSPSTRNLFRAQLASEAETFDEFLENAGDSLAGTSTDSSESPEGRETIRPSLEAAWIFNHELPLEKLVIAVNSDRLPQEVRHELVPAVWTRAILLGKLDVADVIAPQVGKVAPELDKLMSTFNSATTREEKLRAASFALLKAPGLSPLINGLDPRGLVGTKDLLEMDHFNANWWCRLKNEERFGDHGAVKGKPDFISPPDSEAAAAEWKTISSIDDAPIYLANNVFTWAKQTPDDPRIPEALHRVVRATRYGCSGDNITPYSKTAFGLLHRKYPKSEWTKKTKYYF